MQYCFFFGFLKYMQVHIHILGKYFLFWKQWKIQLYTLTVAWRHIDIILFGLRFFWTLINSELKFCCPFHCERRKIVQLCGTSVYERPNTSASYIHLFISEKAGQERAPTFMVPTEPISSKLVLRGDVLEMECIAEGLWVSPVWLHHIMYINRVVNDVSWDFLISRSAPLLTSRGTKSAVRFRACAPPSWTTTRLWG